MKKQQNYSVLAKLSVFACALLLTCSGCSGDRTPEEKMQTGSENAVVAVNAAVSESTTAAPPQQGAKKPVTLTETEALQALETLIPEGEKTSDTVAKPELWNNLEEFVASVEHTLSLKTEKTTFAVGDLLNISVDVPAPGYLNIVNIGENETQVTLLFPNKFTPESKIERAQLLKIPGDKNPFELPAINPGKVLLVAIYSENPLNLWKGQTQKGTEQPVFLELKEGSALEAVLSGENKSLDRIAAGSMLVEILPDELEKVVEKQEPSVDNPGSAAGIPEKAASPSEETAVDGQNGEKQ